MQDSPGAGRLGAGDEKGPLDGCGHWQLRLQGLLGSLNRGQVGPPAFGDGEVRSDVFVGAAIGRLLWKGVPNRDCELAEWFGGLWLQPQDVVAKPSRAREPAVEGTYGRYGCRQGCDDRLVDCRRLDKGVQDCDVGGHAQDGCWIEATTVAANQRFRCGHRSDDCRLRRRRGA